MFLPDSAGIGDDFLFPFAKLREHGLNSGFLFGTEYKIKPFEADAFLFFDFPRKTNKLFKFALKHKKPMFLVMFESELICPDNWSTSNHVYFDKIFTWNDQLVDDIKYFKLNFANEFPSKIGVDVSKKTKLCTLIAGNKAVRHPMELYSKRVEAIRWFERNHPGDFDFFGIGWDEFLFTGPLPIRALNLIKPLKRMLAPSYPSYRGKVERKRGVLENYKFSICYENARDISGYITEKIFDCFFAGCVPIYWGADNVTNHIPADCFIDKRKFTTYEELYEFLISINDNDYITYLNNINSYLTSEKSYEFSSDFFAKTIAEKL